MRPRFIAFYLPQFYPTKENDEWWGKGFTEWTNVGRAKSLFPCHDQPKVPADLGYYDLRLPEVREKQAKLANNAGIEGFCYWHYWFGNGKRLLDKVFSEVVESGNPDYPFCLCWANHSWYAKTWDKTKPDKLLMKQTYPGIEDYKAHFYALLSAFKDKRYITVDGKLLFGVFAPLDMPDFKLFKDTWNTLAKENGLNGFVFFAYLSSPQKIKKVQDMGYDTITVDHFTSAIRSVDNIFMHGIKWIATHIFKCPMICQYKHYVKYMKTNVSDEDNILPCILPNYDHTPRSGRRGILLHNSNPSLWGKLTKEIIRIRKHSKNNIIFIKAWNEWGEGNYLEPDMRYGKGYLEKLKEAITNL